MTDRVGQVWEVKLYQKEPPRIFLFVKAVYESHATWYRTFNLTAGTLDHFKEYHNLPLERRVEWTRLG